MPQSRVAEVARSSMIPKRGNRFSEKIMLKQTSMIPKSGNRFLDKIMLKHNISLDSGSNERIGL
jgi:hypothetical protein